MVIRLYSRKRMRPYMLRKSRIAAASILKGYWMATRWITVDWARVMGDWRIWKLWKWLVALVLVVLPEWCTKITPQVRIEWFLITMPWRLFLTTDFMDFVTALLLFGFTRGKPMVVNGNVVLILPNDATLYFLKTSSKELKGSEFETPISSVFFLTLPSRCPAIIIEQYCFFTQPWW